MPDYGLLHDYEYCTGAGQGNSRQTRDSSMDMVMPPRITLTLQGKWGIL
jgi:hypothetical protein